MSRNRIYKCMSFPQSSSLSDAEYAKLVEAESRALKARWRATRRSSHLCACDDCYRAYVRARIGMAS